MTGSGIDSTAVEEARRYLRERTVPVNQALRRFWEQKREQWSGFPKIIRAAFDAYDRLTSEGKKIRAGLLCLGFEAARHPGSPPSRVSDGVERAAAAMEVLHNAFLIHDDIMDRADLRRNQPTVHCIYSDELRRRGVSLEDANAYGCAVALNFGDKGQALAQELLLSSGFPDEVLLPAIRLLSQVTDETVGGQLLDVVQVPLSELTAEHVLRIHEFKTARYTVMLPLLAGAILARADESVLDAIRGYAIPVGIAFQIKDDILGLYGDQSILGKPIDSDVREGKKTLLFVHAYESAGAEDRALLLRLHGKAALSAAGLFTVRTIVQRSGAVERSQQIARDLVEQGKTFVTALTRDPGSRRILCGLADHLIQRPL
jgi:geranylgeranyl diphosphate synthase type I